MRVRSTALIVSLWLTAVVAAQLPPADPFAAHSQPGNSSTSAAQPASQPSQPAPYVTRQRDVEIPFSVRAGTTPETQPAAVRVFVSWDQGRSWHYYDERRPEDGRFRFKPKQDGEFWFATQTIDRAGRPDSPEPRRPQLKLIIDTQRPQLLVQAQVQGSGDVAVSWSAVDTTLNPASLKFEYQDATSSGAWEAVAVKSTTDPVTGQTQGQASFRPAVSGQSINLRAEIADSGGNVAYFSQRLSLAAPKPPAAGGLAYSPPADPSATKWPSGADQPTGAQENQWLASDTSKPAGSTGGEQVRIPSMIDNPFAKPGRLTSSPQNHVPAEEELLPPPTAEPSRSTSNAYPPVEDPPPEQQSPPARDLPEEYGPLPEKNDGFAGQGTTEGQARDLPEYDSEPEAMPAPNSASTLPPEEPVPAPLGQRPRLTNSRRFSLDYDVEAVGPEGVAAVELWGTGDGGRTWAKWGADPDRASPFDVEVNNESTYGFRIVIVGKSGLATSAPQAGDAADIWVGIDATRPAARLTGAQYGQGEAAGKLEIRWEANDANLGPRPITLAISDRPDGQFTPIAAGIPNTGLYSWDFDPRSPRQIYLRLEVRDEAGNIAIDQLTEPIKVEGLEPKGRIRGFNPAPETHREAFRSPLFRSLR